MFKKKVAHVMENKAIIKEMIIEDRERMPVRGGYMIRTQLMSDEIPDDTFMDQFVTQYQREIDEYSKKFPTSTKTELIQKWRARIDKMREEIKKIRDDKDLNDEEKKHKIERRLEIIKNDSQSIDQALEYLRQRGLAAREMFAKLQNTK